MKKKLYQVFAVGLCVVSTCAFAQDDQKKPQAQVKPKVEYQTLELQEGETINDAVKRAFESTGGSGKGISSKIIVKKALTGEGKGEAGGVDAEDLEGIKSAVNDALNEVLKGINVEGSEMGAAVASATVLIGPDGKEIELEEGETLSGAIQKLIGENMNGVAGIGPAVISVPGDAGEMKQELKAIRQLMQKQTKVLEQIKTLLEEK